MSNYSSFLFIPANKSRYFYNEDINEADALIVDFEDSLNCKITEKNFDLLNTTLQDINEKNIYIRINSSYFRDIMLNMNLELIKGIMLPKFTLSEANIRILKEINNIGKEILILIESPRGILDLRDTLDKFKVDGIFFGSEDYITNINAIRNCTNLFYPRANIINISKAYNISCYDTIFPNL